MNKNITKILFVVYGNESKVNYQILKNLVVHLGRTAEFCI